MKRQILLSAICAITAALPSATSAQEQVYYDITSEYLFNASFDENTNYGADATGNVKEIINVPDEWDRIGNETQNILSATFKYGTAATAYTFAIPTADFNGADEGNCLALSAAQKKEIAFSQSVRLPAGNYLLVVDYYNCNTGGRATANTGISLCGWTPKEGEATLSTRETFEPGVWGVDTIAFTITEPTSGRIQVGYRSPGGTNNYRALLAFDHVRLLRDTPYGEWDDITPPPTVVSDTRFARGATMAFGRIKSVQGENVVEQGFCWGETSEPTIDDNTTTEYLDHSGNIYVLKNLKPATLYYMRAYAKSKRGKVGYGEAIKFYTIPKGNVTYWYNNGGDAAANIRVNNAATEACEIFSNLTEMVKHFNIGYSAGTPTADCYYADEPWMNMGANGSYQRTGTIMHEMEHGFGVIPYSTQWNGSIMREGNGTGNWLGERVSAFLDFWDNTTGSFLHGDTQHMWPYGINGASEDHGNVADYYANAMIGQALGEDGLEHRSNTFAEPYYALNQEDDVKYYLKNESEDRGLYTSYLVPTSAGTLQWRTMTAADAQQNDSTAWYITFTPQNQYYQFRNAATGQYLTFSGGFKTMERASLTANDDFHLMKGRVDASGKRGYWVIHPTGNWTPNALTANANGAVGSSSFNIANSATQQRWLILTADEMDSMEQASIAYIRKGVTDLLAKIRPLADVPHEEVTAGTDQTFAAALSDIQQRSGSTQVVELMSLTEEAEEAAFQFLCNVYATTETPFDLTWRVKDAGIDAADGWTGTPSISHSCGEFYQTTFDFNQTIQRLPAGNYQLLAQGFQRPGTTSTAYNDYTAGNNKVNARLYAGSNSELIAHIATEAQTKKLSSEDATVGTDLFLPQTMLSASYYFKKGLYENKVESTINEDGKSLKIGLRSTSMPSAYWVIFDNFRLHFFGNPEIQGISDVRGMMDDGRGEVYNLQGRRIAHPAKGLYIINGHKVVIK